MHSEAPSHAKMAPSKLKGELLIQVYEKVGHMLLVPPGYYVHERGSLVYLLLLYGMFLQKVPDKVDT